MARGLWAGSLAAMGLSIAVVAIGLALAVAGRPTGWMVAAIAAGFALYLLGVCLAYADWRASLRAPRRPTQREILQQEVARARAERARRVADFAARRKGSGTGRGAA